MEHISLHTNLFGTRTAHPTSRRAYAISLIMSELEKEGSKVKVGYVIFKLSHLKVPDIEWLYHASLDYRGRTGKPFGKGLFGMLKVK